MDGRCKVPEQMNIEEMVTEYRKTGAE